MNLRFQVQFSDGLLGYVLGYTSAELAQFDREGVKYTITCVWEG